MYVVMAGQVLWHGRRFPSRKKSATIKLSTSTLRCACRVIVSDMNIDLLPTPAQEHEARKWAIIVYALQAASVFVGVTLLIAIIINYIKQDDVRGTWLESHFRWQMRTFWFSLLWGVLGLATSWLGVGLIVLVAAGVWFLYRLIKGAIYLYDGKTMYLHTLP